VTGKLLRNVASDGLYLCEEMSSGEIHFVVGIKSDEDSDEPHVWKWKRLAWNAATAKAYLGDGTYEYVDNFSPLPVRSRCAECQAALMVVDYLCEECRAQD
jgi:hypothetical protein